MGFLFFLAWIVLSFIVGSAGSGRRIGGVAAFFISLFFSPLIGLLVVLASPVKEKVSMTPWEGYIEDGNRALYKGDHEGAFDLYMDARYELDKIRSGYRRPSKYLIKKWDEIEDAINEKIERTKEIYDD